MSVKSILRDNRAFGNIIYGAVGLSVFLILIGTIIMPSIINTNTAGTDNMHCYNAGPPVSYNNSCPWTAANIAMWGILSLCVIASAIMFVIGKR